MIDRITVLGGSSVYAPELVQSVILRNLTIKEIVLLDLRGPKLRLVTNFCQRLLDKSGYPTKVIAMTNVAEAVSGAKYVINHVRVGGMKARMRDEMLPPKYGMIGDETLGAGGFANAMRTLPVTLEHARRIEEVNPKAIFINLTNPMGIIIEGLLKYSNLSVVGVNDLAGTYTRKAARILQRDVDSLTFNYIGLANLGWIQDVKFENRSVMSHLLDLLEHSEEDGFDYDLIRLFRMIPTRNTGIFFHLSEVLKKQKSCSRFRAEILHEAEKQILKLYEDEHLHEVPELTRQRNAVWYEEALMPLVQALESDKEKDVIVCVRNNDCVRDLPPDSSVELRAKVSAAGISPQKVGSLPRFLKGVFLAAKESDRLTVEAVRHKSYEYALQALTINPFVPSFESAKKFLDRVIREENLQLH